MRRVLKSLLRREKRTAAPLALAVMTLFGLNVVSQADAQPLNKALSMAYVNNPTLRAERARQRATDEKVPQALSGWRPTVTASGDAGHKHLKTYFRGAAGTGSDVTKTDPAGVSIALSQPIFNGFKTVEGTKQAEADVRAGVQNLLAVEQTVLLEAATAYLNVVRDREIVVLRQRNVAALAEQLRATEARFKVGDITKTDVAQSRSRLAQARSALTAARANAASSEAAYIKAVGARPHRLYLPRRLPRLPKTLAAAIREAERINPQILAAAYNEESARHGVEVAKGDLLPSISLDASFSYRNDVSETVRETETTTVVGTLTVPLYQGGRVHSKLREARHVASQRRLQILAARRAVREQVVSAWNRLVAARQTITSARAQVSATQLALDGVTQEAKVGSRTTLDILDQVRELVEAQVALANARHDAALAGYQLIAAIGRMTASGLGLAVAFYDPSEHYRATRNKFIGTSVDVVE